jgi:hypothetical protein
LAAVTGALAALPAALTALLAVLLAEEGVTGLDRAGRLPGRRLDDGSHLRRRAAGAAPGRGAALGREDARVDGATRRADLGHGRVLLAASLAREDVLDLAAEPGPWPSPPPHTQHAPLGMITIAREDTSRPAPATTPPRFWCPQTW